MSNGFCPCGEILSQQHDAGTGRCFACECERLREALRDIAAVTSSGIGVVALIHGRANAALSAAPKRDSDA